MSDVDVVGRRHTALYQRATRATPSVGRFLGSQRVVTVVTMKWFDWCFVERARGGSHFAPTAVCGTWNRRIPPSEDGQEPCCVQCSSKNMRILVTMDMLPVSAEDPTYRMDSRRKAPAFLPVCLQHGSNLTVVSSSKSNRTTE